MSKSDSVPEDVKSFLRSVLISSNGVKESKVQKDYHELSGERLMWKNYGFKSLNEFLNALPDVCVLRFHSKDKENRVYGVQLEGTYMSSHAKKNVKTANTSISSAKERNAPLVNGRLVQQDGSSFKITLDNDLGSEDPDDLKPNMSGLYQVYVVKLPSNCTESDLKKCFEVYGNVTEAQVVISSLKRKVGFVRYALKNEALRALTEGKKNPPKILGVEVEVGKPKKKFNNNSNSSRSSEPSDGSLSSTPSSPIKNHTPVAVTQQLPSKNSMSTPLLKQGLPLDSAVRPPPNFQRLSTLHQSTTPILKQLSNSQGPSKLNQTTSLIVKQPSNSQEPLTLKSSSSSQIPLFGQEPLSPLDSDVRPLPNSQGPSKLNQTTSPMVKQLSQRPSTLNQPMVNQLSDSQRQSTNQSTYPIASNSQGPSPLNPPTRLPVNPPFSSQTPLSVQISTVPSTQQHTTVMPASNTQGPWTLNPKLPTKTLLSIHPVSQSSGTNNMQHASGVIISAYDGKLSEDNLKQVLQAVGNLEHFEYQPYYSIAYFKKEHSVANVVNELNGKYIYGCTLLVKPFTGRYSVLDEARPTNIPHEEKLPELQNEFSKIYDFYSEAMSRCCGQKYLHWLKNLPACFEVKIMDLIDPCTFWIHLSDGVSFMLLIFTYFMHG